MVSIMGKLSHIASLIYNQPLIITEEKLYEILEAIGTRINIDNDIGIVSNYRLNKANQNNISDLDSGIAVIPISGTLTHEPMPGVNSMSGLTSYQSIRQAFDKALQDQSKHTILLNINSNGGQVNGCFDLVDHIYNSRGQKPIIAISNESAYSAAYALGSAADKFYVTRTAGVGSIGVIALHADMSEKLKNEGIKYTAIKAGKYKDDGSPYKPLTDQAKSSIQSRVDDTYHLFVNTVARNRNLEPEQIYSTEAQVYEGQKAVELGLADKVTTYDNVINTYGGINKIMANTDLELKIDTTEAEDKINKLSEEVKKLNVEIAEMTAMLPNAMEESIQLGKDAERNRVMSILEKCIAGHKIELIEDLVKNDNTPEQAAALIMQSKALESEHEQVSSAIKSDTNAQDSNLLVKNAEARAQAYTGR